MLCMESYHDINIKPTLNLRMTTEVGTRRTYTNNSDSTQAPHEDITASCRGGEAGSPHSARHSLFTWEWQLLSCQVAWY